MEYLHHIICIPVVFGFGYYKLWYWVRVCVSSSIVHRARIVLGILYSPSCYCQYDMYTLHSLVSPPLPPLSWFPPLLTPYDSFDLFVVA